MKDKRVWGEPIEILNPEGKNKQIISYVRTNYDGTYSVLCEGQEIALFNNYTIAIWFTQNIPTSMAKGGASD